MAAINKICEYSDNYPGWKMYGYKRNHIQVEPQFRKQFRGMKSILTFKKGDMALKEKFNSGNTCYTLFYDWKQEQEFYDDRYHGVPKDKESFEKMLKEEFNRIPVQEYEYCLEIVDERWNCPTGRTKFINFTYDKPGRIIKRMKRLVGPKNLTVLKP